MYNTIEKLASAIKNDVLGGLRGYHTNISLNIEQLCDEIINERLQVLKEYSLKGILPAKDLYMSINCIEVDCKDLERCKCNRGDGCSTVVAHFEIPQILNDYGGQAINYIGSNDMQNSFVYHTSNQGYRYHKYRKRGKNKPYIWIDTTPNENGMYDCFLFNAPLVSQITVTAIFKDPRQLEKYSCCEGLDNPNFSFIDNEVQKRLTEKKIRYYKSIQAPLLPNDQTYTQP